MAVEKIRMGEKRVCFDFEVDFSNGGGIQGQGFRLDIEGDHIADQALSTFIIQDLRLLMVSDVRILNKSIIDEPHKRSASKGLVLPERCGSFVDLSHTIANGMIAPTSAPASLIRDQNSFEQSHEMNNEGTESLIGPNEIESNTGTYLDAPYHRLSSGDDLAALALESVSNLPGVVVNLRGHHETPLIGMSFAQTEFAGKAVLVESGWSDRWGTDQYFENFPFLTEQAAKYLRDQGAILVGIDSHNI